MAVSKRLIVNADGFGFGPGATEGILDAVRKGNLISSVSVNANFPDVERIPELVKAFPHISIGVHLNPIVGRPCLPPERIPSLVGDDGCFRSGLVGGDGFSRSGQKFTTLMRSGVISPEELAKELNAQIARVAALAGDRLTHIDSQGNRHLHYFDLFLELARKWGLRRMRTNAPLICLEATRPRWARLKVYRRQPQIWLAHCYRRYQMSRARAAGMRMADRLVTVGYGGTGNKATFDNWLRILRNLPSGTSEIYCHPAYPDDTLRRWSYYYDERAAELAILSRPELREAADKSGVEIVSFDAI